MRSAADAFFDQDLWRAVLAHETAAFSGLVPGARIGILPRNVARRDRGPMLVWQADADGMTPRRETFSGFERCDVDIAFVVDDEAVVRLRDGDAGGALAQLRRLVRRGNVVLYFLKCEGALIEAGYEDFLDTLGLTVLGACR